MASWGALSGLGAGLQQFGNEWSARAKQKLADDLQKQREERAAERELAREKRQEAARLRQVDPRNTGLAVDPATGQMTRILRNSDYGTLRTEALSEYEADGLRRQEQADQAKLRAQGLEAQLKELEVNRLPQKWAQEDAMHRARLSSESALQAQRYASAAHSNRSGLEGTVTEQGRNSATDAQTLIGAYPDLVKEYTTTPRDGQAKLSRDQVEELAHSVVRRSAERQETPVQVAARFREALRIMAERNKNNTARPPRPTGSGVAPRTP